MSTLSYVEGVKLGGALYGVTGVDVLTRRFKGTTELVFSMKKLMYVRKHFILHIPSQTAVNLGRDEFVRMIARGDAEFSSLKVRR